MIKLIRKRSRNYNGVINFTINLTGWHLVRTCPSGPNIIRRKGWEIYLADIQSQRDNVRNHLIQFQPGCRDSTLICVFSYDAKKKLSGWVLSPFFCWKILVFFLFGGKITIEWKNPTRKHKKPPWDRSYCFRFNKKQ